MRSTIGIDIAASPDLVFALAHDVTRWEHLLPHYLRSRSVGVTTDGHRVTSFTARRGSIPVAWRAKTWSEPATRRLRFVHVAGATKGMDVTWTIEPSASGARVEIAHEFRRRLPIPVLGRLLGDTAFPAVVDRWFTRPIAGRTLATFKALAETLAEEQRRVTSDRSPRTNPAA